MGSIHKILTNLLQDDPTTLKLNNEKITKEDCKTIVDRLLKEKNRDSFTSEWVLHRRWGRINDRAADSG